MVAPFDTNRVPCPAFVIDLTRLRHNLETIRALRERADIRVLFAQKAFATWQVYPEIHRVLDGVCASGLYEAKLGRDHFGKLVHTYSPAYRDDEIEEVFSISDHVVFNSPAQLLRFSRLRSKHPQVQVGLRVNPECSVTEPAIYDPCAPKSRLGTIAGEMNDAVAAQIDGLHVHALCERDSHALASVMGAFEEKFGAVIDQMKWVNLGGGHAFTRGDYDGDHFVALVQGFKERHPGVEVIMEPGAAVVWDAGFLVASVLDITRNHGDVAVLDISCPCHTPDVLEMPYRPRISGEVPLDTAPHTYRLGGVSCLAGDVFGDYGFDRPLAVGDRIVFEDMAQYSIVKTTMFNGVRHPAVLVWDSDGDTFEVLREYSYEDYRHRMG